MSQLTNKITQRLESATENTSGLSGADRSAIWDIIIDMSNSGFAMEDTESPKDDLIIIEQFFIHGAEKFCAEGNRSLSKVFLDLAFAASNDRDAEFLKVAQKGQRLATFFMPLKFGVVIPKPQPVVKEEPKAVPAPLPIPATTGPISEVDYSGYDPDWEDDDDRATEWSSYLPDEIARLMRPDLYPGPNESYHYWDGKQYPPETETERRAVEALADAIVDCVRQFDAN